MNINEKKLAALIGYGLKCRFNVTDTLEPKFLEQVICKSFGLDHVGSKNFYADGVKDDIQASIKTRLMRPHVLKRKEGRDFQTHPQLFLEGQRNVKQNKRTYGVEIVQRRQALDFDDVNASAEKIGLATIEGFKETIKESFQKYNTNISIEIIVIHGYDYRGQHYLLSVFWKEFSFIDPNLIKWKKEGYGVSGYINENGNDYKIIERINGNVKDKSTCFKEFKNVTKYQNSIHLKVSIPEPWPFDEESILKEIYPNADKFVLLK